MMLQAAITSSSHLEHGEAVMGGMVSCFFT